MLSEQFGINKSSMESSFIYAWDMLEVLNCALKKLQHDINNEDLNMTIEMIEEKPSILGADTHVLIRFLIVALCEITYFLSDMFMEENTGISESSIQNLKEIQAMLRQIALFAKTIRNMPIQ